MKFSSRGEVREAPDPITWVKSLLHLQKYASNIDAQAILSTWNQQATKSDRVVGAKYATVKNLLEMDEETRSEITHSVSIYGWKGG